MRGDRERRDGGTLLEEDAAGGQRVDVGRRAAGEAVRADPIGAGRVERDQHDVELALRDVGPATSQGQRRDEREQKDRRPPVDGGGHDAPVASPSRASQLDPLDAHRFEIRVDLERAIESRQRARQVARALTNAAQDGPRLHVPGLELDESLEVRHRGEIVFARRSFAARESARALASRPSDRAGARARARTRRSRRPVDRGPSRLAPRIW